MNHKKVQIFYPIPTLRTSFTRALNQDKLFPHEGQCHNFEDSATLPTLWVTPVSYKNLVGFPPTDQQLATHLQCTPQTLFSPVPSRLRVVSVGTMSVAKCLVCVMLVVVAAACASQDQERIKMCGREFIRLAVSTCGSSRLRRSVPIVGPNQHKYSHHCE